MGLWVALVVGTLALDVAGTLALDAAGTLAPDFGGTPDRAVLAVGGTFQAAPGKGQRAGSKELQGGDQAADVLHMESIRRLEVVLKAENSAAAATRCSPGGSLTSTCRLRYSCVTHTHPERERKNMN